MSEKDIPDQERLEAVYNNIRNSIINGRNKIYSAFRENEAFLPQDIKDIFLKKAPDNKASATKGKNKNVRN